MVVIGVNGSPRKQWNTATLVSKALEGAAAQGAETELVHLYDLDFKGCKSCLACKTRGGKSYGKCVLSDDLAPVLEKIAAADALVIGSPIYFGTVTGETRSFLERLLFPYLTYTVPYGTLFPRHIKTGFIYTMNVPEERSKEFGYEQVFRTNERYVQLLLGAAESLCAYDTCQVDDYSKVVIESFDPVHKARRRAEALPLECRRAFELGQRLAGAESIAA
ncbi:flavodoxin family protein [Geobacter sp. SVR]|uniref:flavodoxin family protein n=1 Tax=Geobacter sp. SVR TaxID=2495594 RepID=UPI00143F035C|nr:flavodoxin family protein [Geobacter sp. SVR]BCS55485.1 flavodoxin family protein [Geobacter sp. SVR]GCF83488.1 flavodoxin family protein [Geobacter sp. SVR]